MSKLEELIKEFCPNGVEYVKLCDVADFRAGSSFPEREQGRKAGRYPFYKVVDMNKTQIYMEKANNYINEETCTKLKCKPAPKGTIIFPKVGATMGTNKKRILSIEACYDNNIMGLFAKNIDPKFLYYCFSKVDLLSLANGKGAVPSLDTEKMARIQIPLPALPVQREIVRILDSFTLYSAELTAELTARRKQYEFYRDKLLMPKSSTYQTEWRELKDVCRLVTGATPSTSKKEYWENGTIPWMSSGEVNNKRIFYTEEKITELGYQSSSTTLVPIHSVVIALAGQGKTRGKVAITEIELCTNQSLCSLICGTSMNYKFLYYYLDGKYEELRAISNGDGTRGGLSLRLLAPYKIPVPPIDVQERIVKVLDNFDAICSDLGIGLPAEIEARQKQYEYYRDKLLTF